MPVMGQSWPNWSFEWNEDMIEMEVTHDLFKFSDILPLED